MNTPLLQIIENHPFLRGLPPKYVTAMAECAMHTHFQPGQLIFRRNDTANRFYLILEGKVQLGVFGPDAEVGVETISAGDVLGWSWIFEPRRWQFDARAEGPVDAIFFYATPLLAMCEENAEMGYELMKWVAVVMLRRLQAVRERLLVAQTPPKATATAAPFGDGPTFCGISFSPANILPKHIS